MTEQAARMSPKKSVEGGPAELTAQLSAAKAQKLSLTKEIEAGTKELAELEKKNASLKKELEVESEKVKGVEGAKTALTNNVEKYSSLMEQKEEECKKAAASLEAVESEILQLKLQLADHQFETRGSTADYNLADVENEYDAQNAVTVNKDNLSTLLTEHFDEINDSVTALYGLRKPFQKLLDSVCEKRELQIDIDANAAEELLALREQHASDMAKLDIAEDGIREQLVQTNTDIVASQKEVCKLMAVETEIADVDLRFSANEAANEKEINALHTSVQQLQRQTCVVKSKAAQNCKEMQTKVNEAMVSEKVSVLDKILRDLEAEKEFCEETADGATEVSEGVQAVNGHLLKIKKTYATRQKKVSDTITSIRKLEQKRNDLREKNKVAEANYKKLRLELKTKSAQLLVADPTAGHTVPVTPSVKRAKRDF
eukprot:TRINITY_DN8226_c2_g1_i2.p1 TRINITY_DN8226_c2_g1~~TRINITY_DN8226_c2_g1_i2.p1  ORF type:complete len:429 (+),score=140.33 TRINITY_DN8226_c2_g1_i2:73-1359(+)